VSLRDRPQSLWLVVLLLIGAVGQRVATLAPGGLVVVALTFLAGTAPTIAQLRHAGNNTAGPRTLILMVLTFDMSGQHPACLWPVRSTGGFGSSGSRVLRIPGCPVKGRLNATAIGCVDLLWRTTYVQLRVVAFRPGEATQIVDDLVLCRRLYLVVILWR